MPKPVCQACGCRAPRAQGQFMCFAHWKALPAPLRAQVNASWRAWQNRNAENGFDLWLDYIEATDEAKRLTAEREGMLALFEPALPRLKLLQEVRAERAATPAEDPHG